MAAPTIEFWFDFASPYSYVAAMRVEAEAARAGVALAWRPFLLGPIFTELLGIKDSPFNVQPVRGRYMWRDVERLCAKHGIPWRRPTAFPRSSVLAARVATAVEGEPWAPEVVRALFRVNFAEDLDLGDPRVVEEALASAGRDAKAILARASAQEAKDLVRARTAEASRAGIFGAPDFLVAGELFFGQDRMDDAFAWARRAGAAPRGSRIG